MSIQRPLTIAALDQAFNEALAKAEKEYRWYADRKWRYTFMSFFIRGVTVVAIILGVVLPLTKPGSIDFLIFEGPAQAGYACLLLAVVVLGLDAIFMLSGSWVRYMNAMTKIRTLIAKTEYEWFKIRSGIANDAAAHEQRTEALDLFQRLVVDARKIVEDETAAWGTELGQALQKLNGLVKEQRLAVEALRKEERKARDGAKKTEGAPMTGGVTVEIHKSAALAGVLTVAVGDQTVERSLPIQKVVFSKVPPGQHAVVLNATDTNGDAIRVEDLVLVEVNKVASVKFMLPTREHEAL